MKHRSFVLLVALACGIASPAVAGAADDVVAKVGDRAIARKDLERRLTVARAQMQQQWHGFSRKALDDMILESLLAQEATKQKMTLDDLLRAEVDAKARPITEAEINEYIQLNRARIPANAPDINTRVRQALEKQARDVRRQQFFDSLRAARQVEIVLAEPLPEPAEVGATGAAALGPADAAVTIVEFSDFLCPYCKTVQDTLKKIRQRYGDRVRLVFRDMPILDIHPGADRSAEAGRCAGDQGKFWQYHDTLFANQDKQKPEDLVRHAQDLGLDLERFRDCLGKKQFAAAVAADVAEARGLGVTSTPTFFINGRVLVGAHPFEHFERLVEAALSGPSR